MENVVRKIENIEKERELKLVENKKKKQQERRITKEELLVSLTQKFLGIGITTIFIWLGCYAGKDIRAWIICLPMILFGIKLITTKKWWLYGESI